MKTYKKILTSIGMLALLSTTLYAQNGSAQDTTREGKWYIHFKLGQSYLDHSYNGNQQTLNSLEQSIKKASESKVYNMLGLKITGYASPDGPLEFNEKLSEARAVSLKNYLQDYLKWGDNKFQLFGGGENWDELRVMVDTSKMAEKEQILNIIDNTPSDIDREIALRKLNGGKTYAYLCKYIFPKLRSASTIEMLELKPQPAPQPKVVPAPQPEPQPGPQPEPIVEDDCRCSPPVFALKTNALYWAATCIPNAEVEFYFARRFSVDVEGVWRWFHFKGKNKGWNISSINPELRYWFKDNEFQRWFMGAYYQFGEFDGKFGKIGRQGHFNGAGLSVGYVLPFKRWECFFMEFGGSLGWAHLNYDRYEHADGCNVFEGNVKDNNYFGPTRLRASLVWRF